jgi:hypothetical protein
MKANELRIGNYVTLNKDIKIINGNLIKEQQQSDMIKGEVYLKPIPITEEWLLKFGFLKDLDNDIYLSINPYAFLFWQNDRVELLDNDNNFMISYCRYVHQLQNLYFALTGEELTLKSE